MGGGGKPKSKNSKSTKNAKKYDNLKTTDSKPTQNDKDKKSTDYLTLSPSSNNKTGGFVGGEISIFIKDTGIRDADYTEPFYNGTKRVTYTVSPKVMVQTPIYLVGGYQWYFYNKPHFNLGLRFNGRLGYLYSVAEVKFQSYGSGSYGGVDMIENQRITQKSVDHILLYGTDAQFLWDFLDRDKHSFGVHFSPIGFEGIAQFSSVSETYYSFISQIYNDNTPPYIVSSNTKYSSSGAIHSFSYTINFGIHYTYNIHHQIFVTYRHSWSLVDITNGKVTAETDRYGNGMVRFSYAYKF